MISTCVNGATIALTMGLSTRYTLITEFVKFIYLFAMISMALLYISATIESNNITYKHICHHNFAIIFLD
jgi:hypothetical protein